MNKIQFAISLLIGITIFFVKPNLKQTPQLTALKMQPAVQGMSHTFDVASFYNKQCGFCHTKEEMIGPDMNKIKAVYLQKYPGKDAFIKAVSSFVSNPNKKIAIYKDGIENFMDMPKMPFKTDEIKAVAAYIYDTSAFK